MKGGHKKEDKTAAMRMSVANGQVPSYRDSSPDDNDSNNRDELPQTTSEESTKAVLVRLPRELLKSLREESLYKGTSVNSIIVSILRKYSGWWRFQEKLGFMPLHKSMVKQIMDEISDDDVEEIGRIQKDQTIKDFILFSESGYDLHTFIRWLKLRCDVMGFQLVVRQENDSGIFIMINHGISSKWSRYYKGMFEAVLQELLKPGDYGEMRFNLTNSSFSMTISGMSKSSWQLQK
ncbi:MAG TPA: hypothetical protein VNI77_03725 [Nitrososphaera sp.]|nr:hypothetical protein [Nitrososphaera sp.]